ncbi:MAG: hypothetical protein WCX22_08625 [Methanoregula sp.]
MYPSFDEAYQILKFKGPAQITSSIGTEYTVKAWVMQKGKRKGTPAILCLLEGGDRIYIHPDCWGLDNTCQGTRAGGIYNGSNSLWAWLNNHK